MDLTNVTTNVTYTDYAQTTVLGGTASFTLNTVPSDGTFTCTVRVSDALGNEGSGSATFSIDKTPPSVTINQASYQGDPSGLSTLHFTVVFSETVSNFVTGDVQLSGTAMGNLVATVTQVDTATYDVAVSGMTSSGTVIATVPAGLAQDDYQNPNTASTSTDNVITYILAIPPTFAITVPTSGSDNIGQNVAITWSAKNLISGTTISLYYDTDTKWNGNEKLIATVPATSTMGFGYYIWSVAGVKPGTYYIAGVLNSGTGIQSHMTKAITILPPSLKLMTPSPTSYTAGQSIAIGFNAQGVPSTPDACHGPLLLHHQHHVAQSDLDRE